MMRGTPRRRSARGNGTIGAGDAAVRGALAGLAGGVALVGMSELAARGLIPGEEGGTRSPRQRGPAIRRGARRVVRAGSRRAGVGLTGTQAEVASVALELAAAAGIGAIFGLISSRTRLPTPATGALLGGLVYAATLAGALPADGVLASPGGSTWRDAIRPVGPQAMFGLVTARAFELLTDR